MSSAVLSNTAVGALRKSFSDGCGPMVDSFSRGVSQQSTGSFRSKTYQATNDRCQNNQCIQLVDTVNIIMMNNSNGERLEIGHK